MAKTKYNFGIIFILILGLGLRLVNLGQSFWLDEATQAQISQLTLNRIWAGRSSDFHPPLFYLFTHFWQVFGQSEIWLRLPSVIFGVINVYLVYLLAKKISPDSRVIPWIAALFMAINPFHIYYSQEYRSYSLLCLLGTFSMYFLYTRRFWLLVITNVLIFYTHYSGFFLIITQVIYIALYRRNWLTKYLQGLLITSLLYLPWLPQLTSQLQAGVSIDTYLPGWRQVLSVSFLKAFPLLIFKLTAGRITFISTMTYLTYIIFVLFTVFFSFRFIMSHRNFLITWALLPMLIMISVSFVFPQTQPFRVIYVIPALVLIFAQAVSRFPKLFITLFIYIFLVGNLAYFTRPRLQREQWSQSLSSMRSLADNRSVIVVKFSEKFSPFWWYAPDLKVIAAIPEYPARTEQVSQRLSQLKSSEISSVWLFDYLGDLTDPGREVDLALTNLGFTRQKTLNFEGVGFIHYFNRI